ncbi:hypothetical protein K2P47_00590 [Patescibacteria group bacterium]|nr:hypothetical protein [Patescibacteria group bacterium]
MKLQNTNLKNQSGFVALMSTIVIGATLLVMTIQAGISGFYTSFLVLGNEAKEQSRLLAFECGNRSLALILSVNNSTNTPTVINEIGSCTVYEIKKESPSKEYVTVRVHAEVRGSVTNLDLIYKTGNIHLNETTLSNVIAREMYFQPVLDSVKEVSTMP